MIKIILAVAILAGAVFIGPRLADSQGFVHIATNSYIIETSLTTAIIVAIFSFFILHVVVNILTGSIKLPSSISKWFSLRNSRKVVNLQAEAFVAYEEGAYARSLALIKKSAKQDKMPSHCLLLASKAAFKLGDYVACRSYLDSAEKAPQRSDLACKLLRSKLNLKINNTEAALENLNSVSPSNATTPAVLKLYVECYEQNGDYAKLKDILAPLKKQNIISDTEYSILSAKCYAALVKDMNEGEKVQDLIKSLNRTQKGDPIIMAPLLTRLVQLGKIEEATSKTLSLLSHSNAPELLKEIAKWEQPCNKVLEHLNKQLSANETQAINVPLLAAVSNLELLNNELENAKKHIDQALEQKQNADIYFLAAKINDKNGAHEQASAYYALANR